MNRRILNLALPSIISNITVPLLGLVDTAIVGHMGSVRSIGAIAVGSMIFNVTYWLFGFLRMGTGGLTAQAYGREDMRDAVMTLTRSMIVAMGVALLIIIAQVPLTDLALWIIGPDVSVKALATTYCRVCVWGAPAVLGLFALNGWFVGMQNTRIPMVVSIVQNIVNILASLFFVYVCRMQVEGVATGTLVAQWVGFLVSLGLMLRHFSGLKRRFTVKGAVTAEAMRRFFTLNRDIFLRTVCLVAVNLYFVTAGAHFGKTILAANTLLMQFFTLYSFIMDGFAYAGEALCGRYYGAQDTPSLRLAIKRVFQWSLALTTLFTLLYIIGADNLISILTDHAMVKAKANEYLTWVILIPFAGLVGFVWDGVFIGMTLSRGMLTGAAVATAVFFATLTTLTPSLGNHALWLAFILYLSLRGIAQTGYWMVRGKRYF